MKDVPPKIELPQTQESKEKKKKTIEIKMGENTYTIETESYDFEYPEKIQKETGIIGYERTKVSNENLFKMVEGELKPLLEKYNINSFEEFVKKYKELNIIRYFNNNEINKNEKEKLDREIKKIETFFGRGNEYAQKGMINFLLKTLSNNEYPNFCYNQRLGAYGKKEKKESDQIAFKEDKFFLQKIYDVDRIEKMVNTGKNTRDIFQNPPPGHVGAYSNFDLYDSETNEKLETKEYIGEISKYKEDLESKKVFSATPNGGLNMVSRGFFSTGFGINDVAFGFPMKNDSFFKEYLEKAVDCFYEIEIKNNPNFPKRNKFDGRIDLADNGSLLDAFTMYVISQYSLSENISAEKFTEFLDFKLNLNPANSTAIRKINNLIDDFFKKRNSEEITQDFFYFLSEKVINNLIGDGMEIKLPIFIGRDDIPQLSWGHAKYAHYFNEKGLNYFEFKHTEHLPVKQLGSEASK